MNLGPVHSSPIDSPTVVVLGSNNSHTNQREFRAQNILLKKIEGFTPEINLECQSTALSEGGEGGCNVFNTAIS